MSSSFYEKDIWAFIQVLEHQPELFSEQDKADLNELNKALTKDVMQISKAVKTWLKSRPEIFKAHVEILDNLCDGKPEPCRGPGGLPVPPPPSEEELRQQLANAIRQNTSPASQPKKPEPDEKSK